MIAENTPAYQLELVREQAGDLEEALSRLVRFGLLEAADVARVRQLALSRRSFEAVPFLLQLDDEEVARYAVHRHELPGVMLETRMARHYPYGTVGAHALGYVGTISADDLARVDRERYYGTGVIGKTGVERAYEQELLGTGGYREVLVNAEGRPVKLDEGADAQLTTHEPQAGKDLRLTIDIELQRIAEDAFAGRRGGVVAIDPSNGDVLVFASLPSFDPNGFARGISRSEYLALTENPDQPLFNRVLRGTYPPGSTIKPLMALAGLEYDVIKPDDHVFCPGSYSLPGSRHRFRDFKREGHGSMDMENAVMQSCDVYFYRLANTLGIDRIHDSMARMGFGEPTGIDIAGERGGIMPSPAWKKTAFSTREQQVWFPGRDRDRRHRPGLLDRDPLAACEGDRAPRDARQAFPPAARAGAGRSRDWRDRGTEARGIAVDRAEARGELGDHRQRDGRRDERPARHGAAHRPRRHLLDRRQDGHGTGLLGRADREVRRKRSRRAVARPRALRRLRARRSPEAGDRGTGRERRIRLRGRGADRARDLRCLPREGAPMIYGELGDSRTRRTVTGMARLLRALRLDGMLLSALIAVSLFGLFVLYSAAGDNTALWFSQLARIGIGFMLLIVLSQVPDHFLRMLSPAAYLVGLILLVIVAFAGDIGKGAQRWLDLGVIRFQPSEIMKLAVPMMCAWYMHQRPLPPSFKDIAVIFLIVIVPVGLIAEQPDLGTALLVAAAGMIVLVMGGLSLPYLLGGIAIMGAAVPVAWHFLHEYQRQRVLTLLDPQSDALGAGYHIIQSQIAIGSGGVFGKGWMNGSQAQLEFLPERSTDFIFAVIGEELGLLGLIALLVGYLFIVGRGTYMALQCRDEFARLLAGSIALTFFVYACVNAGMVMGLLPVVGVPLPLVSYGGTSFVTLMAGFGILMSLHSSRKLVG